MRVGVMLGCRRGNGSVSEYFIAGKDASLEASIERMQAKLAEQGLMVEMRAWLHPLEHVWSVHLFNRDCPSMYTNGKGATQLAAQASALGEFFERLSCNYFWNHYFLGGDYSTRPFVHHPSEQWFPLPGRGQAWPKGLLTAELQAYYNPEKQVPAKALVDLNSGQTARGICALPYTRLRDQKTVYFPVNLISNLYVSNGMAAGNTRAEARAQALSEILERHVKYRVIAEEICLPEVPEAVLSQFPDIVAGIDALRAAGFHVLVKDASLGGCYPVVCVALLNPHDHGLFVSFGAHPQFQIALERALTELLQGRGLDALAGFPPPGFDVEEIASIPNLEIHFVDSSGVVSWRFLSQAPDFPFVAWNFGGSTTEDYDWLCACLQKAGHDIYVADFEHFGVYACRILVPGFSEIYPVDDLEWENNSQGIALRAPILQLPLLEDAACKTLLSDILLLNLPEERPVCGLIGLLPPQDTLWAQLRVGELKALLALAVGDREMASEACAWCAAFVDMDAERRQVFQCLQLLLALDNAEDYTQTLSFLFDEKTRALASALWTGQERFWGLTPIGEDLSGSSAHRQLLAQYEKAYQAMQRQYGPFRVF